jgi:hypothetical protein
MCSDIRKQRLKSSQKYQAKLKLLEDFEVINCLLFYYYIV